MSQYYDTLHVMPSDDGYVVTVEMHRPEALNAMNTAMGRELLRCFEDFFWDKQTRVVILTGAGDKAFCVGGDLKERQGMSDEAWREQHVIFEQAAFRILRCPLPVIAAVEGFAMGGGCELAVLSDFVVASETAVVCRARSDARHFPWHWRHAALATHCRHAVCQGDDFHRAACASPRSQSAWPG